MLNTRFVVVRLGAVLAASFVLGGCNSDFKWPWQSDKPAAFDMSKVAVSDSGHEKGAYGDFGATLTIDGNLAEPSSWRVEGAGQWILYDLKEPRTVSAVQIAFLKGNQRKYTFAIELSADNQNWVRVFEGQSAGASTDFERFTFQPALTRYVKLVGGGNTDPKFAKWFNLTEVKIEAGPAAK